MSSPLLPATGHYHLHVHPISKLKGHSIRAAAAYRRAERFAGTAEDAMQSVTHAAAYQRAQQLGNDGQVFDYRRKVGVAWTGIMAPEFTPKELLEAQTLWNTVERIEHRKNARLAREMIIALPHQVDLEVQIAMLRAFVSTHLLSRGMIADVAIHRPPVEHGGDPRNWHAHVLLTDRPMTPTGFAAIKDRTWNAKENLLLWRKAWADTHNETMASMGLPYRIDHRSLEAQRQEALAMGDTVTALDLRRTPQIHVGKAAYGKHPNHTIYRERREQNRAILTGNKNLAAFHADALDAAIARADTAAYVEARDNAVRRARWQTPEPDVNDLQAHYGRPDPTSVLGEMRIAALKASADAQVWVLCKQQGYPWMGTGHRHDTPSLVELLLPKVKETGPGHPLFTVTAKDLVFAFYGFGLIGATELQTSLEYIAQEEQRLFVDRIAKKPELRPPQPLPKRKPPAYSTFQAERLKRVQRAALVPEALYMKRAKQLRTFESRHLVRTPSKKANVSDRRRSISNNSLTTGSAGPTA
jgi:hypothetical protein